MTIEEKLVQLNSRYNILREREANIKSGGVLRKLRREIRNLNKIKDLDSKEK